MWCIFALRNLPTSSTLFCLLAVFMIKVTYKEYHWYDLTFLVAKIRYHLCFIFWFTHQFALPWKKGNLDLVSTASKLWVHPPSPYGSRTLLFVGRVMPPLQLKDDFCCLLGSWGKAYIDMPMPSDSCCGSFSSWCLPIVNFVPYRRAALVELPEFIW